MKTNPFFSVITVTHNNLEGLQRTRASLMAQNCDDYEWIIIDGASTDGSALFLNNCDARVISEPDQGIYDAMNKGIEMGRGDYIIFMNAGDNFAAGNTLERIKEEIKDTQPDFIYGDALETLSDGGLAYKKARLIRYAAEGMITHHQAMFYRRDTLNGLRFNQCYKISADFDFTLRFLKKAVNSIYCPFPFCVFKDGGISQQRVLQGRYEQFRARAANDVPLWKNSALFLGQSALWSIRKLAPSLYWQMKARS